MIQLDEIEGLYEKHNIEDFFQTRDVLWANMSDKIAAHRAAARAIEAEFFKVLLVAFLEKKLCYYLNMGGQLCRGHITKLNSIPDPKVSGNYGGVFMCDIDTPSAFDKYEVSYHQVLMIEP